MFKKVFNFVFLTLILVCMFGFLFMVLSVLGGCESVPDGKNPARKKGSFIEHTHEHKHLHQHEDVGDVVEKILARSDESLNNDLCPEMICGTDALKENCECIPCPEDRGYIHIEEVGCEKLSPMEQAIRERASE